MKRFVQWSIIAAAVCGHLMAVASEPRTSADRLRPGEDGVPMALASCFTENWESGALDPASWQEWGPARPTLTGPGFGSALALAPDGDGRPVVKCFDAGDRIDAGAGLHAVARGADGIP